MFSFEYFMLYFSSSVYILAFCVSSCLEFLSLSPSLPVAPTPHQAVFHESYLESWPSLQTTPPAVGRTRPAHWSRGSRPRGRERGRRGRGNLASIPSARASKVDLRVACLKPVQTPHRTTTSTRSCLNTTLPRPRLPGHMTIM